jgi:hypothetical protein
MLKAADSKKNTRRRQLAAAGLISVDDTIDAIAKQGLEKAQDSA